MSDFERAEYPSASLDILLGSSWKVDARCLARLCAYGRDDDAFDFTPILDIVDIVVDGANITSRLPEESIFCLMHELLGGLCMLVEGRLDKHIVSFSEAGWELAIQRAEGDFEISFYGTAEPHGVSVHNVRVTRDRLLNAACTATERLIDDLVDLNEAFRDDGMVRSLERQLVLLYRLRAHRPPRRVIEVPPELDDVVVSTGSRALGLEVHFDASHEDFWRYEGALISDLHSLLFTGSVTLRYWGRRRAVADSTYVFPVVEALVGGAERLIAALERRQGGCVLLDGTGTSEAMLTVDVLDTDRVLLRVAEPSGSVGRTRTSPEALFNLLVDSARDLLDRIVDLNAHQILNRRVNDLRAELERLRGQFHDVRRGDQYFDGVQRYLREAPIVEAGPGRAAAPGATERSMAYPLAELRHVFLKPSWYLARHRLQFGAVTSVGKRLLVPSEGRIECLDRRGGGVVWEAEADAQLGPADGLVLARRDGAVVALDAETGGDRFVVETRGQPSSVLPFRLGDRPAAGVVCDDIALTLLDLSAGRPMWRFRLEHGEIVGTALAGPVLVVVADDGFAYGLTPATGEVLWKVRVPGTCLLPPSVHQGRLYICADSDVGIEGMLYSIYPLTGRRVFERRSPATFSQPPLFVDDVGLFTLETPAQATVAALNLEDGRPLWTLTVENAQIDTPVLIHIEEVKGVEGVEGVDGRDGLIVVKTDTGQCLGVDPSSGAVRWRTPLLDPGDILLANLRPARIDGHVVVAERFVSILDPATGERRHRFVDLPEHPCYLQVDDDLRLILGDGDDHLECFDLSGFLALVD